MYPLYFSGKVAWLTMMVSIVVGISSLVFAASVSESEFLANTRARLLFPYATVASEIGADYHDTTVLLVTIQYPVYGVILVVSWLFGRARLAIVVLLLLHTIAVLV
jgi:hypothetical protein